MRVATSFKVLSVNQEMGEVVLKWNNGVVLNHRIPLEYETAGWTENMLRDYLSNEAPDIPDMPQFLLDEVKVNFGADHAQIPGDPPSPP